MARIMVGLNAARILGEEDTDFIKRLDKHLSFFMEGAVFSRAYKGYTNRRGQYISWDGRKHLLDKSLGFPAGLVDKVLEFYKANNKPVLVEEVEERGINSPIDIENTLIDIKKEPYYYQTEAADCVDKYNRGIIRVATGGGKCNHPETPILLYNGEIKKAKNIKSGDILIGDDGKPRKVVSTCTGQDNMYEVFQRKGDSYKVNKEHILSLRFSGHKAIEWDQKKEAYRIRWGEQNPIRVRRKEFRVSTFLSKLKALEAVNNFAATIADDDVLDISVKDYISLPNHLKHVLKGFKAPRINWPHKPVPFCPYILGAWLGDGSSRDPEITTTDQIIIDEFYKWSSEQGFKIFPKKASPITYSITGGFRLLLKEAGVLNNKHIPIIYKVNDATVRLEVLAGIIDTDGHLYDNCIEIIQKNKCLADDIVFLARSLGFGCNIRPSIKKCGNSPDPDHWDLYWRIVLSGTGLEKIPVRIERKRPQPRSQKKDPLKTGIKVKELGKGKYCGFTLDGNGRYLLGDFTVTHNSLISALMVAKIGKPTFIYVIGKDLLYQIHDLYTEIFGEEIGLIGDGHCEIKKINIATVWTVGQAYGMKKTYLLDEAEKEKVVEKTKYSLIQKALSEAKVHIFDECHLAACDTIQTIMKNISPDQIYGMSASPWRDDGADLLIEGYLGKTIVDIPARKLIEEKYLVPPLIKFWPVPKMELPKNYKTIYKRYITENPVRNELVIKAAVGMVNQGYKPLILFQDLKHGKTLYNELKTQLNCAMLKGSDSSDRRREVKTAIEEGNLQAVLASKIFDVGVDLPSLSGLVVASAGKSSVRALQRIGRVIRKYPGKTKAAVVDFADNATYLSKHARIRRKIYSMEFDVQWPKKR